jgi:hypothetical protein
MVEGRGRSGAGVWWGDLMRGAPSSDQFETLLVIYAVCEFFWTYSLKRRINAGVVGENQLLGL